MDVFVGEILIEGEEFFESKWKEVEELMEKVVLDYEKFWFKDSDMRWLMIVWRFGMLLDKVVVMIVML